MNLVATRVVTDRYTHTDIERQMHETTTLTLAVYIRWGLIIRSVMSHGVHFLTLSWTLIPYYTIIIITCLRNIFVCCTFVCLFLYCWYYYAIVPFVLFIFILLVIIYIMSFCSFNAQVGLYNINFEFDYLHVHVGIAQLNSFHINVP